MKLVNLGNICECENVAQEIGSAYHGGDLNKATQLIAHAALECVTGSVAGGDCAGGAVGGVAGEIAGSILFSEQQQEEFGKELEAAINDGTMTKERATELMQSWKDRGINITAVVGGLSAALAGGDVNSGADAASNAAENNVCGTGACVAVIVAFIAGALEVTDKVLVAKDAYDIADATLACQGGNQAACDRAVDLAEQAAIDAGIEFTIGSVIPGSKAAADLLRWTRKNADASTLRKIDNAIDTAKKGDVPQVTRNRLHHEQKVGEVVDDLEARGYQVDAEVSFRGCDTTRRCRADVVARDENGRVAQVVEVKTGDAGLSPNQAEIYPQVANGDAIPTGQVAERLGLRPGVPLRDQGYPNGIPVEVRTFEGVNQ